jgi:hypothetical protein
MKTVAGGRRTTDGVWLINLCRDWKNPWQWSSLTGDYANSGLRFAFTSTPAPAVRFRFDGHPAWTPHTQVLTVRNPTDKPLELKAAMRLFRNVMPELNRQDRFALVPGESRELTIAVEENDPTTVFELSASVTDAFRRDRLDDGEQSVLVRRRCGEGCPVDWHLSSRRPFSG